MIPARYSFIPLNVIKVGITRLFGAAAAYALTIIVARALEPHAAAKFFVAFTTVAMLSQISRFGLDTALLRVLPNAPTRDSRAVISAALTISLSITLLLTAASYVLSAAALNSIIRDLPVSLPILTLVSGCLSLVWIGSASIKALERPSLAVMLESAVVPLLTCVAIVYGTSDGTETPAELLFLYSLVVLVASIFIVTLATTLHRGSLLPSKELVGSVCREGAVLVPLIVLSFALLWAPIFILEAFAADSSAVTVYTLSLRTALLIALIPAVFNSISAPRYATMFGQGNRADISRLASDDAIRMTILAAIPLAFTIAFPQWTTSVFGEEYTEVLTPILILMIGQVLLLPLGPVDYISMMIGAWRQYLMITASLFAILVVGCVFAASSHGATGVSIVVATCLFLQRVIAGYVLSRRYGITSGLFRMKFR